MKATTLLSAAVLCSAIISCKGKEETTAHAAETKTYKEIAKAEWFLGNWANRNEQGTLTETWVKANDSVYKGESYFVVNKKDTAFAEHVTLQEAHGKLAYIVTVPGQNAEQPVRFEMTSASNKQIVFENPAHDFPSKIIYNKVGNDSLKAEITGMRKGVTAVEKFVMAREK